jgi:hypothetical protein
MQLYIPPEPPPPDPPPLELLHATKAANAMSPAKTSEVPFFFMVIPVDHGGSEDQLSPYGRPRHV